VIPKLWRAHFCSVEENQPGRGGRCIGGEVGITLPINRGGGMVPWEALNIEETEEKSALEKIRQIIRPQKKSVFSAGGRGGAGRLVNFFK